MKRRFWIYALPILLLLAVTLPHLDQGDFRAETAHYAAIGVQSWRNTSLFWTPHEHPEICYFNKPPLVIWIHGLFLHLFGISLAAVRLPTILAAAGCVWLTVGISRQGSGRILALTTGCVMALTYEFFRRSREICLDMWQLLFMLGAVWIWTSTSCKKRPCLKWLAGIPLGLALMCKPLMALMVVPILGLWTLLERRPSPEPGVSPHPFISLILVVLTALLVALPWHASMIQLYGDVFTRQYFGHELVERFQGLRNQEPGWYYLAEISRTYWPWMLTFVAGLVYWKKRPVSRHHRQLLLLATTWTAIWTLGLSVFPDKRPRYELPLYPMMAMIAAFGLVTLNWPPLRKWYRHGLNVTALLIVTASLIIHFMPIRFQDPPEKDLTALVEWAKDKNPVQVYSAAMTAIDESTIYLKAGYWPTPLRLASKPIKPGSYLIYSDRFKWRPPSTAKPVLNQGPYHVVEL